MGLRDFARAISPPWLVGSGPPGTPLPAGAGVSERLVYALSFGADALAGKVDAAIRMRFPGYGDASALAYTGSDRVVMRGLAESDAAYAKNLVLWLDSWRFAGTARSVIQAVAGYLTVYRPLVESTLRDGVVAQWIPDGSDPYTIPTWANQAGSFVWDTLNAILPRRRWLWINSAGTATGLAWCTKAPLWGSGQLWGTPMAWGFSQTTAAFQDIMQLVQTWKGAGTRWFATVYFAGFTSPTLGTWGSWARVDTSGVRPVFVPARDANGRYLGDVL